MAVRVPGWKAQVTALTATWPPKRMVRSLVAGRLIDLAFVSSGASPDHIVARARLLQCGRVENVVQAHVLHGALCIRVAARGGGAACRDVRIVAGREASGRGRRA